MSLHNDDFTSQNQTVTSNSNIFNYLLAIMETSDLNKKRYKCNHSGCTKRYTQKFRLNIHKRTHVS